MTSNADDSEIDGSQLSVGNITQGSEGHQNEPNDDLDSELMSDFSKLQINSSDCLRTFSPIGSERTSPDQQENFLDSNEDINNLLAPHENDNIEDDVLSTGNARTDNLLKEITGEGRSYKSAELFSVNPSELENEFQEGKTPNEDLSSGEKAEDVIAIFEKDAENQPEIDDQFGDEAFKPASEAMWELDYLEQCGNNREDFQMSALARQSLYVKFDPLVKGGSSQTPG
ncbi:uncharacterized protein LOC111342883 [Stylophora pistillata]|uniref:uncharacterized protein LOC111342883 n=1 Tax=Stylophora pistillata TaxID=50429 RepID=UPI000C0549E0|nr:uncharacterized protein LOC111342883 [Stylophora pistillata]